MIFRTGANTSRAAQTALAPLELLDPRNLVQFWSNYGDFVANRQFTQERGKHAGRRRLDEADEIEKAESDTNSV